MPYCPKGSQFNNGKQRCLGEYNANNGWIVYGTNGCLNNNNKMNSNAVRLAIDSDSYDNGSLESYLLPLSDLYLYNRICRKNKGQKPSQLIFEFNLVRNLARICHEVNNYEYIPRPSICFVITYPRLREVMAADFGDRIVQTFYYKSLIWYLEQYHFHPDSYACRVGKGGLRAIQQFQEYVFEESNGYTEDVWLASIDIKGFFMSIDTDIAVRLMTAFIEKHVETPYKNLLVYLTRIIYQSLPQEHCRFKSPRWMWTELPKHKSLIGRNDGIGIPIGNVTSQMMATFLMSFYLWYLTSLGYKFVHYSDDTGIIIKDKEKWREDVERIERFLREELHLTLHPHKRYIQHYSKGIQLLGYKVRFNRVLLIDRTMHNFRWKVECAIRKAKSHSGYVFIHKEDFMATVNSYLGLLKWTNSWRIRVGIIEQLKASPWAKVYDFDEENYSKVTIKKEMTRLEYYKRRNKKRRMGTLNQCKDIFNTKSND